MSRIKELDTDIILCKEECKSGNMKRAAQYWNDIFDFFNFSSPNFISDQSRLLAETMMMFTEEEVRKITNYIQQKMIEGVPNEKKH